MSSVGTALEHRILELINETRAEHGLNPLTMEVNLNSSADNHSNWMTATDTFSHTGVSGSAPSDRMIAAGTDLRNGWGAAENIAAHSGYSSEGDRLEQQAQAIHDGFMNSPPHRANILNGDFTHVGIGVTYGPMTFGNGASMPAVLVTQNFAYSGGTMEVDYRGTGGHDRFTADVGVDILDGMDGNDTLDGKAGNDTLKGGKGNDFLKGGKGNDSLSDTQGNNKLAGQKGQDKLTTGSGEDKLLGGGGRDTLNAGDGNDFLKGGTSNDIVNGGNGDDQIFGNRDDDTLNGGSGDDFLNGGGEDDKIDGGSGDDTLKGGDGQDVFVFSDGRDVILDYDPDQDRIRLDDALYGNDASAVVDDLATVTSDGVILDFGNGNRLEILGNFTLSELEADLSFF